MVHVFVQKMPSELRRRTFQGLLVITIQIVNSANTSFGYTPPRLHTKIERCLCTSDYVGLVAVLPILDDFTICLQYFLE